MPVYRNLRGRFAPLGRGGLINGPGTGSTPHFELAVRNISGLAANFRAAEARVVGEIKRAVQEWGDTTRQVTRELCPVDTRFMREHIKLEFSPNGLSYEVGWKAEDFISEGLAFYPFFVECGTVKMNAQPSLFPAHEITAPQLTRDIGDILRRGFSGAAA